MGNWELLVNLLTITCMSLEWKPHMHGKNMQTAHRKASCSEMTAVATSLGVSTLILWSLEKVNSDTVISRTGFLEQLHTYINEGNDEDNCSMTCQSRGWFLWASFYIRKWKFHLWWLDGGRALGHRLQGQSTGCAIWNRTEIPDSTTRSPQSHVANTACFAEVIASNNTFCIPFCHEL